jgi:hypothetical protein
MRSIMSVCLAAAVLAIGAIAFAASVKGTAELQSFGASGVTGSARLNEVQPAKLNFQAQIRGLDPGAGYRIQWYTNTSCTTEAEVKVIEAFKANPAGMGSVQATLARNLPEIGSISVVRVSDNTVVACGAVQQTQ